MWNLPNYRRQAGKPVRSKKPLHSSLSLSDLRIDKHETPVLYSRKIFWIEYDYPGRWHKCFTTVIIGHHCNSKYSIESATKMLEEMGIAEVCMYISFINFDWSYYLKIIYSLLQIS